MVPAYIEDLAARLTAALGDRARPYKSLPDELAIEVAGDRLLEVARILRDDPQLRFELLMDLSGVDYLDYGRAEWRTDSATTTHGLAPVLMMDMDEAVSSQLPIVFSGIHEMGDQGNNWLELFGRGEPGKQKVRAMTVDIGGVITSFYSSSGVIYGFALTNSNESPCE